MAFLRCWEYLIRTQVIWGAGDLEHVGHISSPCFMWLCSSQLFIRSCLKEPWRFLWLGLLQDPFKNDKWKSKEQCKSSLFDSFRSSLTANTYPCCCYFYWLVPFAYNPCILEEYTFFGESGSGTNLMKDFFPLDQANSYKLLTSSGGNLIPEDFVMLNKITGRRGN